MKPTILGQWIRPHRNLLQLLRIVIVFGLLGALLWVIPIADVLQVLAQTNLVLLAFSFILIVPVLLLISVQLHILANTQKLGLSLGRIVAINLTLRFYDLFLPGGGAAVRWYKMSQPTGKKVRTLAVLALNRLLTMFLTLSVTLGFWILSQSKGLKAGIILYGLSMGAVILAWLVFLRFGEPFARWLKANVGGKQANPLFRWIVTRVIRLMDGLRNFSRLSWVDIVSLLVVGIGWQLIGTLAYTFKARSVAIDISISDLGWIRGLVTLATILPISFAGGLGIREVSTVALLVTLGVSPEQALAFSLLTLAQSILVALIGGLFEASESLQATRLSNQS